MLDALRTVASARITHFILLSVPIFLWDMPEGGREFEIRLSEQELDQRVRRASSSDVAARSKLDQLRQRVIEDAVLVEEARRLGLDEDDEIIRARLVQKMLFVAEELGGASQAPTEEDLRAYYREHRDELAHGARYAFSHVFARTPERARSLLPSVRAWAQTDIRSNSPPFGDPFPAQRSVVLDAARLATTYGPEFMAALGQQPLQRWVGPIASRYGAHLVRITERAAATPPAYHEVRPQLPLLFQVERRRKAIRRYLDQLLTQYDVWVGEEEFAHGAPRPRLAARGAASVED